MKIEQYFHPSLEYMNKASVYIGKHRFITSSLGLAVVSLGSMWYVINSRGSMPPTPAEPIKASDSYNPKPEVPGIVIDNEFDRRAPTVTSTPLKPTQESFPTKESTEISIDKTANLFSSPDSRATFQPYDPSIKVTKDTIIGQFGDFIQVKGEKSSLFLPKQSTQNLPPGLKELSADQISEWPSLADLKSKNKDAGNITVPDVFKISVNLKENEGLALTDLNGNQLLIQINANSQLYFQSKQGPNIMTAEVGQPGEYNRGTLRIDLKNQKVTFYDTSGKPIVQNVPIDRNVPANPVLLFPDRRIQTAKLNAAGDSNAQILGMPDGRYIDPKTRIPTATAVLPTPEDTRVPAPATVPAKPAAATPTQKPPEATATAIPSPEVTKPFEDIGDLQKDGFTIHNMGTKFGIIVSSNTIGVPPGQNPTEANLQYVKDMFSKYRNGKTLEIFFYDDLEQDPYPNQSRFVGFPNGQFKRFVREVNGNFEIYLVLQKGFDLRVGVVNVGESIESFGIAMFLNKDYNALINNLAQSKVPPKELALIGHPGKFGVIQK